MQPLDLFGNDQIAQIAHVPPSAPKAPSADAPTHQCLVMFGMTAHSHVSRSCSAIGSRLPMMAMRPGGRVPWPCGGGRVLGARDRGEGGPARPGQRKRTPHKNFFIF